MVSAKVTAMNDIRGIRFGRLTAIERIGTSKTTRAAIWECRCDCQNECSVVSTRLRSGNTASCGCLYKETRHTNNFRHGLSHSPEYRSWRGMFSRCCTQKNPKYPTYGGRGIAVCKRWRKFTNFISDMGFRPTSGHSIDRINNDGNYEPSNCRWATRGQQQLNKRRTRSGYMTAVLAARKEV